MIGSADAARTAVAVGTLAVATLLVSAGATASRAGPSLTRAEADAIATRVLRPQADRGEVVLFGLPEALARGTVVVAADPVRRSLGKRVRSRVRPLLGRAWLYWLDRAPDAAFSHPSEYLLVDDRTGRVLQRVALGWYPTVDGKSPAFLANEAAYESARYRVYARLDRGPGRRLSASSATRPPSVVPKPAFKNDCILMVGDYHGPGFGQDFRAVSDWGAWAGVRTFYTAQSGPSKSPPPEKEPAPSGSTLRTNVDALVDKQNCKDILLFLDGHGIEEGQGPPTVITSNDVEVAVDGRVEKFTLGVNAEEVANVIARHPAITFKLKVNSCYSGRFLDELAPNGKPKQKNLLIAESASASSEPSYFGRDTYEADGKTRKPPRKDNPDDLSEFVNQNVTGLYTWGASQTEVAASLAAGGSLLANALERAFTLGQSANAATRWGAHPQIARGEAGAPPEVSVNSYGLGADFRTPWALAWIDNGTATGAMVFSDRAGNQVGALDTATGRADRFALRAITNPNGIAAIDPFRFAVAGYGGIALFDRTPPGRITEFVLADSRLVNLAVGSSGNLYATNIADNSFVTIRPPYGAATDVSRTPLPPTCVRPTGIVPTELGLTVVCGQSNNVVFLDPSGGLLRSVALPTPSIGAQEPKPTGRGGIVFSGFTANRVYRLRNDALLSAPTGQGPAVPTVAYYPDDYDDLFARQTTDDYAFVPHFGAGSATVAEFGAGAAASDPVAALSARNLVGSAIGPGCSPWVAEGTPGRPGVHRVRFPVQGAPTRPRPVGTQRLEHPPACSDFTDAARTHTLTIGVPSSWKHAQRVDLGIVGYRGDPWGAKATFLANFPITITAKSTGGSGTPRATLRQTGASTAVAGVTGIPSGARSISITITSRGAPAPFGLLTAARVQR